MELGFLASGPNSRTPDELSEPGSDTADVGTPAHPAQCPGFSIVKKGL